MDPPWWKTLLAVLLARERTNRALALAGWGPTLRRIALDLGLTILIAAVIATYMLLRHLVQ